MIFHRATAARRDLRWPKWDEPTGLNPHKLAGQAEKVIILTEGEGQDQKFLWRKVACGHVRSGKHADCSWRGLLVVFDNGRMLRLAPAGDTGSVTG